MEVSTQFWTMSYFVPIAYLALGAILYYIASKYGHRSWFYRPIKKTINAILYKYYSIRGLPAWRGENPYGLVPAFMLDGEVWYQFSDGMRMPMMRAVAAGSALEQIQMGITTDVLQAHFRHMKHSLDSEPRNVGEVSKTLELLEQRVKTITDPATLLQFAAINYVRRGEDPEMITEPQIYLKTKELIDRGLDSFFLALPFDDATKLSKLDRNSLTERLRASCLILLAELRITKRKGTLPDEQYDYYKTLYESVLAGLQGD